MNNVNNVNRLFLHKSLPKILLPIVLFFSGCSLSTEMIDLVGSKIGRYNVNGDTYRFFISSDAKTYKEDVTSATSDTLVYSSRGTDYIIYKGYDGNNNSITVHLTELTGLNGVLTRYKGNEMTRVTGFSWEFSTIAHKIANKTGSYMVGFTSYTFIIGDDGLTYTDTMINGELSISKIGTDYIEYQGYIDGVMITVALTDITDYNGTYTQYKWNEQVVNIGFYWK